MPDNLRSGAPLGKEAHCGNKPDRQGVNKLIVEPGLVLVQIAVLERRLQCLDAELREILELPEVKK